MDFLGINEVKIAVVDDSRKVRKAISNWVSEYNQCSIILEMENGVGVADKIRQLRPNILILDDAMPIKSGFDVISDLNMLSEDEKPYIIMMSEITLDYISLIAIEKGADDFVYKPLTKTNFLARLSLYCVCFNLEIKTSKIPKELPYEMLEELKNITYSLKEKNSRNKITAYVYKLLLDANFSSSHERLMHIEYAVESIIFKYGNNYTLSKHIYPDVARIAGISPDSVEYAIRHAISEAWKKCLEYNEVTGTIFERFKKKPSNAELIKYIANLIELKYNGC